VTSQTNPQITRFRAPVVTGRIVVPPIAQVELDEVPELNSRASDDWKTVITV
jgi:hypothetical protein